MQRIHFGLLVGTVGLALCELANVHSNAAETIELTMGRGYAWGLTPELSGQTSVRWLFPLNE